MSGDINQYDLVQASVNLFGVLNLTRDSSNYEYPDQLGKRHSIDLANFYVEKGLSDTEAWTSLMKFIFTAFL
jgi:hypothetical protein